MGFPHTRTVVHTQMGHGEALEMFTVVASRTADPSGDAVGVELSTAVDRLKLEPDGVAYVPVRVVNRGERPLSPYGPTPVMLSYHVRLGSGRVAAWDGLRTPLPRVLGPGEAEDVVMTVKAPPLTGPYVVELTLVEESVAWFEDVVEALPVCVDLSVTRR